MQSKFHPLQFIVLFIAIFILSNPSLAMPRKKSAVRTHQSQLHHQRKRHVKIHRKMRHRKTKAVHKKALPAKTSIAPPNLTTHLPAYTLNSTERQLISFVMQIVTTLHYSVYQFGGSRIDKTHGIYIVDCSSYVDHILKSIYPHAYSKLTTWSGTAKPTTDNFYHYIRQLKNDRTHAHWQSINDVKQLRPGDVLVIRYKNSRGDERGGHIMLVMDKPSFKNNAFAIRVADSASGGHSKDTRPRHASGVGVGTLLLKINPVTSRPLAYAWKIGSKWETRANFAMARPLNTSTV